MSLRWLLAALAFSIAIFSFHLYNLAHDSYFFYWWVDIPMHILGGALVGTFFIALVSRHRPFLFLVVMSIVFVGWELFEYTAGLTSDKPGYAFDTAYDLLNGAFGAAFAYVIARRTLWR